MLVFDKLWNVMDEKGVSTSQLKKRCGIDSKAIQRLQENYNVRVRTLIKLCSILDCRIEDIVEYIPDE